MLKALTRYLRKPLFESQKDRYYRMLNRVIEASNSFAAQGLELKRDNQEDSSMLAFAKSGALLSLKFTMINSGINNTSIILGEFYYKKIINNQDYNNAVLYFNDILEMAEYAGEYKNNY